MRNGNGFYKQILQNGYVKQAVKQGNKMTDKNAAEIEENNRIKHICLSCESPKCNGECKKFSKKKS